jgi:uncharacterized protein (DUF736 family)
MDRKPYSDTDVIGKLWKNKSKKGNVYLSGYLQVGVDERLRVIGLPNLHKKSTKSPDFVLILKSQEEDENE